ncbi:hypothetical protein IOK49_02950 [Fervidicoccus fontis]|uniref:Uncharacterized protein n=1 Tax=Fervidicoccus fontis TaxID=683846 RepID=A0A2J6N421_9CREN|nr:hypothetical protein [Fervidicoccus fontis]MBE9391036.1 hypothetical protein [Fervidicoccus fontis]PMB76082.1 MAG: hypothetical protein C0188_00205 [Fervidicoccus fontis]PMB77690.1 MAG: hypothetical protein C0177_02530 [Fervidicoccus fontis]HEW63554.1 hypothetical protein [Fervidicoccus fontis]
MSIYWYRCDLCGKNSPTANCTIKNRKLNVCYRCFITFKLWNKCSDYGWKIEVKRLSNANTEEKLEKLEFILEEISKKE